MRHSCEVRKLAVRKVVAIVVSQTSRKLAQPSKIGPFFLSETKLRMIYEWSATLAMSNTEHFITNALDNL